MRAGLHCFGLQDYMSRIRGGHNFYQVRVNEAPLYTFDDTLHLLLAFNKETVDLHWHDLAEGGGILHDTAIKVPDGELGERGVRDFSMPLTKIAEQEGGHKIMMNTAAIGAMAGLTSFPFESIADVIESNFKRKGSDTVKNNLKSPRSPTRTPRSSTAPTSLWKLEGHPQGASSDDDERQPGHRHGRPGGWLQVHLDLSDDARQHHHRVAGGPRRPVRHRPEADRGRDRRDPDGHRRGPRRASAP